MDYLSPIRFYSSYYKTHRAITLMEKIGDLQHIWLRPHKFEVVTIWSYINSNTVTVIITMPVARIVEDVFVVLNWKTRKEIENCWDWNLTVWKLRQVRLIDLDTLNIKDDGWCWLGETLSATFQFFSEASRKKDGVNENIEKILLSDLADEIFFGHEISQLQTYCVSAFV